MTRIVTLPSIMQVRTGGRAVCGMCGKCGLLQEPQRHLTTCIRLLRKCSPETAKKRATVLYALRDTEQIRIQAFLTFRTSYDVRGALRANRISPKSIKEWEFIYGTK